MQALAYPTSISSNLKYTAEAAKKAAEQHRFVYVGGLSKTGVAKGTSQRSLSGAARAWKSLNPAEANIIFNVQYRIAGTPENVAAALSAAGYNQQQISGVLADAITRDNVNSTKAQAYLDEVGGYRAFRDSKKARGPRLSITNFNYLAENIDKAQLVEKGGKVHEIAKAAKGGKGARKDLGTRIRELTGTEVMDVSEMTPAGVGAIKRKKRPEKGGKTGVQGIPIISDKIEPYIAAVQAWGGPNALTQYKAQIDAVRAELAKVPVTQPIPPPGGFPAQIPAPVSPSRVPGAQLAAQPTFVPATTSPRRGFPTVPPLMRQ